MRRLPLPTRACLFIIFSSVTSNRGDGGNVGDGFHYQQGPAYPLSFLPSPTTGAMEATEAAFVSREAASSTRITEALAAEARASVTSHRIGGGNGGGFHSREATASNAGDGFHCQQQAR